MEKSVLKSIVEGVVFSHSEPLNAESLAAAIQGAPVEQIQVVLEELEEEYRLRSRGFLLSKVAGGYQFRSLPTVAPWILAIKNVKPSRLSRASLETLAIIAYNQPITRSRIEQIRGVEGAGILKNLLERDLITIVGRKDIAGRPLLYGTTRRFLELFSLPDLASLPPLPEIQSLDAPPETE